MPEPTLVSHRIKVNRTTPRETLGDQIAELLNSSNREAAGHRRYWLVTVVPIMQSFFAMSPERYETTEVDVIVGSALI